MVGRFINADKPEVLMISFEGIVDKNLYAYCNNNPVVYKDVTGEIPVIVVQAAVGATVNLASEWVSASVNGEEFTIKDAAYAVVEGAIVAGVTAYVKPVTAVLIEGVAGAFRSAVIARNEGYEVFRDGLLAGLGAHYSIVGKFDRKFIDDKFVTEGIKKAYELIKGVFEFSESLTYLALTGILDNKINANRPKTGKEKQKPGRCHTRTWFKEREM